MSNCEKSGCYLPDKFERCPACGEQSKPAQSDMFAEKVLENSNYEVGVDKSHFPLSQLDFSNAINHANWWISDVYASKGVAVFRADGTVDFYGGSRAFGDRPCFH